MKRLAAILFAGGTLWLFLAAGAVFADNGPHLQRGGGLTADTCAGCHRAHTAGSPVLTVQAQPAICYQCHGLTAAGSSTGVQGGVGTGGTALRGGGIDFALLDSANPVRYGFGPGNGLVGVKTAAATTSHHSVDFSDQVIWGNGNIAGTLPNAGKITELRCGSCHNPHGNRTYRILRPLPVDASTTAGFQAPSVYVNDVTDWQPPAATSLTGAQVPTVGPGGTGTYDYTTTNYWRPQDPNWKGSDFVLQGDTVNANNTITLGQDSKDFLGVTSQWCATCHTRYMANSGDYDVDSGDAIFKYRHPVWGTASAAATANASTSAPACLQCHVSHGTNAAMGTKSSAVTLPGSNTVPAEKSRLLRVDSRGVCQVCHFR